MEPEIQSDHEKPAHFLKKRVHHNRWLFWTLAVVMIIALLLLNFIHRTILEWENQSIELLQYTPFSWKIFRSRDFHLSLRYPPSWQIEIDPQASQVIIFQNPLNFNENVTVAAINSALENEIRQAFEIQSQEQILVDQHQAAWLKGSNPNDAATTNIVLIHARGKLYYIAGASQFFERIISSVKFLP